MNIKNKLEVIQPEPVVEDVEIEDFSEDFVVTPKPKPGETAKATLVEMAKTTWRQIIPADKIERFKSPDASILVMNFETADGRRITEKLTLPRGGYNVPENSRMGSFVKTYGQPKKGLSVKVIVDSGGYWRLLLP